VNKRIFYLSLIIIIVFFDASCKSDEAICSEFEEKYGIDAYPLWRGRVGDYVFINKERLIFSCSGVGGLVDFNINTRIYETIRLPYKTPYVGSFSYDPVKNDMHLWIGNDLQYYLLHLEDFFWEKIPELQEKFIKYYYSANENVLYFKPLYRDGYIVVFDMVRRRILEERMLPNFIDNKIIYSIGGNPVNVLTDYDSSGLGNKSYCLYNFSTHDISYYPELMTSVLDGGLQLDDYICFNNKQYLCIDGTDRKNQRIILLDFENNSQKIIFEGFEKDIYNLKMISETEYSFLAKTKSNLILLCIIDLRNLSR
jgi:hypothetical protein